jgi:tetratricopeptide (TPR) repeat protein
MTKAFFVLVAVVTLLFSGCASIGPGRVTRDRFDYTARPEPAAAKVQPSQPQPPGVHYQAARAALMGGNMEKANLEAKLALQDNPLDAASHFLLGCLLVRKGENDQAIVGFQRALAVDPTNHEALYNLGTMLLWRGEAVPASHLLENAVLIRPDHVPSYNNLAKAYFQAGLPELTVAAYEEVLRLDPSNAIALKNLLLLSEAVGFHDAAATYQRRLKTLGSSLAAKTTIGAGEPITLLPTWPLATAAAGSPPATPLPVIPVAEPQTRPDKEADALRELLRDLPHVTVERRAGRLTLTGWTSGPKERAMLDRILGKSSEVLDLTSDDTRDPQSMIEIDAVLFIMTGLDQQDVGFNFLKLINLNFNYFASDHKREGTGYAVPPAVTGVVGPAYQWGWIFAAASSYSVNIANATDDRIAVLARPHLTALSGTSAKFLAGGELVYKVAGNISGDIKPYPFGTTLTVTPTLLRTPAEDGTPRVHVRVEAGRTSVLALLDQNPNLPTTFTKVTVASEAVLSLGRTLILSGLNQRESHTGRSGVPVLMNIPILKYLFSTKSTIQADTAVIILLTPRDPAFSDERNRKARAEFVEMRRAFLKARQGTEEDMRRFREHYPDWQQVPPNRFASHLFLMETSEIYRSVSGEDFTSEDLGLDLLGPKPK